MEQFAKLIARIVENLPKAINDLSTDAIQAWVDAPLELQAALRELFFRIPLKTWKTIKVVAYKTVDQCRQALKEAGCQVSDWANDLISKIDFTKSVEEKAGFIKLTVAQLGFANGATLGQILDRAPQMGLLKCQSWDGPVLRVQYKDQPLGEVLFMGMNPIADSDGRLRVFYLEHDDDGLWFGVRYSDLSHFFRAARCFIFRLRK